MSRIFLSHSNHDSAAAIALRDWLVANGWDDIFLDLDPERGIAAGERWERSLYDAANRCEAVIFVLSRAWAKSDWCRREYQLAEKLNKRVFGVVVDSIKVGNLPAELRNDWQAVDLTVGKDHDVFRVELPSGNEEHVTFSRTGLKSLRAGLLKAGLDPKFFSWPPDYDPERAPYRGMRALDEEDAGIFFGREAPTVAVLDRLRGLRERSPPRLFVILGASGAGKSSFLRAGLMARLQRDDANFLVLPAIRPGRAAISGEMGLISSLAQAATRLGFKTSRSEQRSIASSGEGELAAQLRKLADKQRPAKLAGALQPESPTVVLAIDQAEELFAPDGAAEARQLLQLVSGLSRLEQPKTLVLFTMRSDSYERLQTDPALADLGHEAFNLPPLPKGAYQTVIEGPAQRLHSGGRALRIEPNLTQALLKDIEEGGAKDALPLLSFTLERLYVEHGGDGDLRLSEYEELGGIRGSLDAAVQKAFAAADNDPGVPREKAAREALLRRALIPWLAGVDPETNTVRRRVARFSDIPDEARPLMQHLIEQRLLSTDTESEGGSEKQIIEPAHEALLRHWGLLQGWLEEDFSLLATLAGIRRAARDWLANGKDGDWLGHRGSRLEEAEKLKSRKDLTAELQDDDWQYLAECRKAENEAVARERRAASRIRVFAIAASLLAFVAGAAALYGFYEARIAGQATDSANYEASKAVEQAAIAKNEAAKATEQTAIAKDQAARAAEQSAAAERNETKALAGLARATFLAGDDPSDALKLALIGWPRVGNEKRVPSKEIISALGEILPRHYERQRLHADRMVRDIVLSSDGTHLASEEGFDASPDGVTVWDLNTGKALLHDADGKKIEFSSGGKDVATLRNDGSLIVWNLNEAFQDNLSKATHFQQSDVSNFAFSPDGRRLLAVGTSGLAQVFDLADTTTPVVLDDPDKAITGQFSPDGKWILTSTDQPGSVSLWDSRTGKRIWNDSRSLKIPTTIRFSSDGTRVLLAHIDLAGDDPKDKDARVLDAETGNQLYVMTGMDNVDHAESSPDGKLVVVSRLGHPPEIWDFIKGTKLGELVDTSTNSLSSPIASKFQFSSDGERILAALADGKVTLWSTSSRQLLRVFEGSEAATFSVDSHWAFTGVDETIRKWDAVTGLPQTKSFDLGKENSSFFLAYSPDGTRIAIISQDQKARIWDLVRDSGTPLLSANKDNFLYAGFSPDSTKLLTSADGGKLTIWDAANGNPLSSFGDLENQYNSVAVSPDGTRFVTAGFSPVAMWDIETRKPLFELPDPEILPDRAAFIDSGNVVWAALGSSVDAWELPSKKKIASFRHASDVSNGKSEVSSRGEMVFSPAGMDNDRPILSDLRTGKLLVEFRGKANQASFGRFSPDLKRLVTSDGYVWDISSGAAIAVLGLGRDSFETMDFSPDGKGVVAANGDSVQIWNLENLEAGDAVAIACQRLGQNTGLDDIVKTYGLAQPVPICGNNAPLPVDPTILQ